MTDKPSARFECGCEVALVSDDSLGFEYPGNPAMLFDLERCGAHSLTSSDEGPIGGFIADYVRAHPFKPAVKVEPPPPKRRLVGCGRGNHDYRLVSGKSYAVCSKCPSSRTVGGRVFHNGVA